MHERVTVGQLAAVLDEPCYALFARILKILGQGSCVAILVDALTCEAEGGLWLEDLGRRRSPGGTFRQLVRERSTPEERRAIFRRAGRRA